MKGLKGTAIIYFIYISPYFCVRIIFVIALIWPVTCILHLPQNHLYHSSKGSSAPIRELMQWQWQAFNHSMGLTLISIESAKGFHIFVVLIQNSNQYKMDRE